MEQKKGIIFDLDGTLLDSLQDIVDIVNSILLKYQLKIHTLQEYRYFVGYGSRELFRRCAAEADDTMQEIMTKEFGENYMALTESKSKLYDGIEKTLEKLFDKELKIAVLSNKPDALTKECVQQYLGDFSFHAVFGEREGIQRKPHPAGAIEIAQIFGLESKEIVFVGDTRVDMETANACGMYPLGVGWGFRDKEELAAFGAKKIITHPEELLEIF